MSLKFFITGDDKVAVSFRKILEEATPDLSQFRTVSGRPAFDKDAKLVVPTAITDLNTLKRLGNAFDYAYHVEVARIVDKNKENAFLNFYYSMRALEYVFRNYPSLSSKFDELYVASLLTFVRYIYQGKTKEVEEILTKDRLYFTELEALNRYVKEVNEGNYKTVKKTDLYNACIFFAKIEDIGRSGIFDEDFKERFFYKENDDFMNELDSMMVLFKKQFIESNIIKHDSIVVTNPHFGAFSFNLKGANADLYVDGTLYEIKSNRTFHAEIRSEVIVGYYLLSLISKANEDIAPLSHLEIDKLAIYYSRYGEIVYFVTDKLDKIKVKEAIKKLLELFDTKVIDKFEENLEKLLK